MCPIRKLNSEKSGTIDCHQRHVQKDVGGPTVCLLTVNQTAEVLGCSSANVYGLISAGDIPVVAVGRSRGYRIDQRDIDEFIERRKQWKKGRKPAPPTPRPRLKHIRL